MASSTTLDKSNSPNLVSFSGYTILMKKIKNHIATCECCRKSLSLDNNKEAGSEPAPNADTHHMHNRVQARTGSESD